MCIRDRHLHVIKIKNGSVKVGDELILKVDAHKREMCIRDRLKKFIKIKRRLHIYNVRIHWNY